MSDWKYPTAFNTFGPEERSAAHRVLLTGKLTMGEECAAFEREFAAFHGKKHGIMCNSGSSANLLMIEALFHKERNPLRPGDKVLVPAIAWSTTYAPLVQMGLDLVLLDVDDSWNAAPPPLQPPDIVGARLVVGASILGIPAHLAQWREFAWSIGAYFIEDNCESVGARDVFGRLCGTYGLMSSSSFFWSHQINGIEGGMVLTDDDELMVLCRQLRAHGWTRDTTTKPIAFDEEYDFRLMGYNLRGLEIHAAVAREQLRKLETNVVARWMNADRFYGLIELENPYIYDCITPSMFGLQFMCPEGTRNRVAAALRAAGVDCRLPTGGSFRKHAYGLPWANQATPKADRVHENGMFIGNAPFDLTKQIDIAVDAIQGALDDKEVPAEALI